MSRKSYLLLISLTIVICITSVLFLINTNVIVLPEKEYELPEITDFIIEEQSRIIEQFEPPVADKYMKSLSSKQGLRDALTEEQAGKSTSGIWHNGIDIPVPEKTPVYASKSGIVYDVWRSYYNGPNFKGHKVYGGLVVIYHTDNTISLYAHLSRTDVQIGEWVEQGQQIGLSGGKKGKRGSGTSTGPHLHFLVTLNIIDFINFEP